MTRKSRTSRQARSDLISPTTSRKDGMIDMVAVIVTTSESETMKMTEIGESDEKKTVKAVTETTAAAVTILTTPRVEELEQSQSTRRLRRMTSLWP